MVLFYVAKIIKYDGNHKYLCIFAQNLKDNDNFILSKTR